MRFFIPEIQNGLPEQLFYFYQILYNNKIDLDKIEKCKLLLKQIQDYNGKNFVGNEQRINENLNVLIDCHARWRAESAFNHHFAPNEAIKQRYAIENDLHDRASIAFFTIRQQLFG